MCIDELVQQSTKLIRWIDAHVDGLETSNDLRNRYAGGSFQVGKSHSDPDLVCGGIWAMYWLWIGRRNDLGIDNSSATFDLFLTCWVLPSEQTNNQRICSESAAPRSPR
jgi:hypothetical protein